MFGYKLVKEKELEALKDDTYELINIVSIYGVFTDQNGNLNRDKEFDSDFVTRKWDRHWDLVRSIVNKLGRIS